MKAGLLKELITIETPTVVKNTYGEEITEWTHKYSTRARLIHNSGNRNITNSEVFYSHTKTLQIRDYVPVDDFDRILWNSKYYRITDIEPNKEQMMITVNIELIND